MGFGLSDRYARDNSGDRWIFFGETRPTGHLLAPGDSNRRFLVHLTDLRRHHVRRLFYPRTPLHSRVRRSRETSPESGAAFLRSHHLHQRHVHVHARHHHTRSHRENSLVSLFTILPSISNIRRVLKVCFFFKKISLFILIVLRTVPSRPQGTVFTPTHTQSPTPRS